MTDYIKYNDIINKSRPVSLRHKKMSNYERAAQFSPFAALTGYDDAIVETARLTDNRIELNEDSINILNERFAVLQEKLNNKTYNTFDASCKITVTYFVKDELKEGGHYENYSGYVRTIDNYDRILIMHGGKAIKIDDISNITADMFEANQIK